MEEDIKKIKLVWKSPEPIVGIVRYKDKIIVATTSGIYELIEDDFGELKPVQIEINHE